MSVSGSNSGSKPVIGITIGDAAGIGPEIVVKALTDQRLHENVRPVVIGDAQAIEKTIRELDLSTFVREFDTKLSNDTPDVIELIDLANLSEDFPMARVSPETGRAAGEYIAKAVELWKNGVIDAISTAPINKRSLELGGFRYPGHTEFIAALTGTTEFAMSFFAEQLRVVLLSTHLPLIQAIKLVKTDALIKLIEFTDGSLSSLLGKKVKIAVAGVNPHASEGGKFGSEEKDQIEPAIDRCIQLGINVSGPYSPDTIFLRGYRGEFDVVIACYHDQATIAVKSLSFGTAVNVTLGLPLVRTSVDHGTAFDIAGTGAADETSMKTAIFLAAELFEATGRNSTLTAN